MKRSEMIKKITKILRTWEDCALTDKASEEILSMMEEEGMMAPETDNPWFYAPGDWEKE
jgi:hypothetical protein